MRAPVPSATSWMRPPAVPTVDILVNNNGGPPRQDFREIDLEALLAGVVGNMAAPSNWSGR
jgi:hypothetical protein